MAFELVIPAWVVPLCAAPLAGSFAGVLVSRLPMARSPTWSRSQCEACKCHLSAANLVPVVSYVALRGRCSRCGALIDPFHLVIELLGTAVACWAALVDHSALWLWTACILGWTLLALAWIDARHMRLPDMLTLPLLAVGIGVQAVLTPEHLPDSLLGAVVGYASFQAVSAAYRAIRGREGLGPGDAKLMAAAGAWLGWSALPDLVLIAALLAIVAVTLTRLRGRVLDRTTVIPFGPFLAASLWLTYVYGPLLDFWLY